MLRRAVLSLFFLVVAAAAARSLGMKLYSQTQSGTVGFPDSTPFVLTFNETLPPATDATLSLFATGGELASNGKRLEGLLIDGLVFQTPGQGPGVVLPVNFLDTGGQPVDPVTIPLADLTTFAADGEIEVSAFRPGFIAFGAFDFVLEYTSTIPEPGAGLLMTFGSAGLAFYRRRA